MNPPTKPITMTGGIDSSASARAEWMRIPIGSRVPCAGTTWPSATMATSEKMEEQIEVPIWRNEFAFIILSKYLPQPLSLSQYLTQPPEWEWQIACSLAWLSFLPQMAAGAGGIPPCGKECGKEFSER